jgi:hypothetical protein
MCSIWAKASSLRNLLFCASAIQNAMQWIKSSPDCSLAVRRLCPWVHLSHGLPVQDSLFASSCRTGFSPYLTPQMPAAAQADSEPPSLNPAAQPVLPSAHVKTARSW